MDTDPEVRDLCRVEQVIASQPMAKKELNTKRNTVATTPYLVSSFGAPLGNVIPVDTVPERIAIDAIIPNAPKSIKVCRPVRSIKGIGTSEARLYSVPFAAARSRAISGPKPSEFSDRKVA